MLDQRGAVAVAAFPFLLSPPPPRCLLCLLPLRAEVRSLLWPPLLGGKQPGKPGKLLVAAQLSWRLPSCSVSAVVDLGSFVCAIPD